MAFKIIRTDETIEGIFHLYIQAREAAIAAKHNFDVIEEKTLAFMEERRLKTLATEHNGKQVTGTYTQRHTNVIDEKGLRKALTAPVYDRYTEKKLDRKKLEQAMSDRDVDPVIVAKFVEKVPGKTHVTYREGRDNGDSATDL